MESHLKGLENSHILSRALMIFLLVTLFLRMAVIQISFPLDGKKEQIPEQDVYIMSTIILIVQLGNDQLLMDQYLHQVEQEKADRP